MSKAELQSESFGIALRDELLRIVQTEIYLEAERAGLSADDMDCTLVFVYISKVYGRAILGRMGDSAICVIKEHGSVVISDTNLTANGTHTLLSSEAGDHFDLYMMDLDRDRVCGFILTSDGLENVLYTKGSLQVSKTAESYFNAVSLEEEPGPVLDAYLDDLTADRSQAFAGRVWSIRDRG